LFVGDSASSMVGIMVYSCIVLSKKNERVYICCLLCIMMYSKERDIPRSLTTHSNSRMRGNQIASGVIVFVIGISLSDIRRAANMDVA